MKIAFITSGGAGMFCGSCMQDNTLARALMAAGHDVQLIPTYTPLRLDEEDVSSPRIFMGGINVYLLQQWRFWRRMPAWLRRPFDHPWLLRAVSRFGVKTDAAELGELTLSMLRGEQGRQASEIHRLADYLADVFRPDVTLFSNALIAAVAGTLKRRGSAPLFCMLQGDDIFLQALPEPQRTEALNLLRRAVTAFDGFIVHSGYYREFMAEYLGMDAALIETIPLAVDAEAFSGKVCDRPPASGERDFTVGYFARICPEKGLHVLVAAMEILWQRGIKTRLAIGGFLPPQQRGYLEGLLDRARRVGGMVALAGAPDRAGKVRFLQDIDVFSVPTVYREPKGIYVLEAMSAGVPVIVPDHGAFPELVAEARCGLLVPPENPGCLAEAIDRLRLDPQTCRELGESGRRRAVETHVPRRAAEALLKVVQGGAASDRGRTVAAHC